MLIVVNKLDAADRALYMGGGRSGLFDVLWPLLGSSEFYALLEHILFELLLQCLVVMTRIFALLLQLEDAGASRGFAIEAGDVKSSDEDSDAEVAFQ